jgi:hypothetical protein
MNLRDAPKQKPKPEEAHELNGNERRELAALHMLPLGF